MAEQEDVHEAQRELDTRERIHSLKVDLYSARKAGTAECTPARNWGGAFTGMIGTIRMCDVEDYITYLIRKAGI